MWKPRNRAWISTPRSLLCVLGQPLVACCDLQHDPLRVGRGQLISLKTRFSCALQPIALIRRLGWHTSPVTPARVLNARSSGWFHTECSGSGNRKGEPGRRAKGRRAPELAALPENGDKGRGSTYRTND